jgi:hypothetical protein
VKRAAELFVFDEWGPRPPFVGRTWRTRSVAEPSFISVAASHWEIVVTRHAGVAQVTIRGPETRATEVPIPADAEFFGIEFSLGAFMPHLPLAGLVDHAVTLPHASRTTVWIDRSRWEIPTAANADVFVERLIRQGVVVHDATVVDALRGDIEAASVRTLQRRVARATGLTRRTITQLSRAEAALAALERGASPVEVARTVGYADQAHLTRSLKRFFGQTPAQVASASRTA